MHLCIVRESEDLSLVLSIPLYFAKAASAFHFLLVVRRLDSLSLRDNRWLLLVQAMVCGGGLVSTFQESAA